MKLIAILSGSDWYDASVNHIKVPENLDLKEAKKKHDEWYKTIYTPQLRVYNERRIWDRIGLPKYYSFSDFIKEFLGGQEVNETDIEIFEE